MPIDENEDQHRENPFESIPIEITVSVGKARPSISDVLQLSESSVLALDKKIEDPVDLYVGDRLIGTGYLEEDGSDQENRLVVRLTKILRHSTV